MATARERLRPRASYEVNFYSWAREQADLLKERRFAELDLGNLALEIEDLAKARARELESRYATLVQHLLKWQFQPERRSFSWVGTVRRERLRIDKVLKESPGLKPRRAGLFAQAYPDGRAGPGPPPTPTCLSSAFPIDAPSP